MQADLYKNEKMTLISFVSWQRIGVYQNKKTRCYKYFALLNNGRPLVYTKSDLKISRQVRNLN